MSFAYFTLIKFSKFISKKVDLEACFLCSRASWRLKHTLFYSKLKFFIIKTKSNLLYRTRIARKVFIVTRILEKWQPSLGRISAVEAPRNAKTGPNVRNPASVELASKFLSQLDGQGGKKMRPCQAGWAGLIGRHWSWRQNSRSQAGGTLGGIKVVIEIFLLSLSIWVKMGSDDFGRFWIFPPKRPKKSGPSGPGWPKWSVAGFLDPGASYETHGAPNFYSLRTNPGGFLSWALLSTFLLWRTYKILSEIHVPYFLRL